ncbi:TolC family protein [Niveispirillum fermenti]|uniref:TolC family protein n=1 Tax=Niveispirillum fermenti TaxID=1233113 RepID=UPI003A8B4CA5
MNRMSRKSRVSLLAGSAILLILTGCTVTPEPLTLDQQIAQAAADRQAMFASQEAVTAPLTLEQAMARALKYNLQHRVTLMEQALEDRILGTSGIDMLPKLATRAGLRTRSNVLASVSESVETGQVSLVPSTSSERTSASVDLQLGWNVLDFGLSYYGAKAQANKLLAAEERRRRVVLNIIEQVRAAWWEAATAERLKPQVAAILDEARQALEQSRQAEEQRLLPPLDALRYQKALLEIVQQLEALEADMAIARTQLASLMNLPPATPVQVAVPDEASLVVPKPGYTLADLEAIAMVERPEVREEAYIARNAAIETRMSLLKLLPGATLFAGLNYDSNDYLVNNDWADAGVQVSWNLLNVLHWSKIEEAGEAREKVAEIRRQALRMAVLAQVNLAWHRHARAERLYDRYASLEAVETRIQNQIAAAAASDAQTKLERIRSAASALLAKRARDRAYAELQNAYGAINQAAGFDPVQQADSESNIETIANAINAQAQLIQTGAGSRALQTPGS